MDIAKFNNTEKWRQQQRQPECIGKVRSEYEQGHRIQFGETISQPSGHYTTT